MVKEFFHRIKNIIKDEVTNLVDNKMLEEESEKGNYLGKNRKSISESDREYLRNKDKMDINPILNSINRFLKKYGINEISREYRANAFTDEQDVFYKKNDVINIYTNSLGKSRRLLNLAKEENYTSIDTLNRFFYECDFQIEYHYLLLSLGFTEREIQSLGITYKNMITFYKRIGNQNKVIDLSQEALVQVIEYKYMDFKKEKELAIKRLSKLTK